MAAPPSKLVQDAPVGNPQRPRTKRPSGAVERRRAAPDRQEGLLDDLFGGGWPEAVARHLEHQAGVARVQRPERLVSPARELSYKVLVGQAGLATGRSARFGHGISLG